MSFKDIPEDGARLPISTAAGEGTLRLILPDKIRCLSEGYTILPNTAVALTDSRFGDGYNAVINPLAAEAVNNITSINEGTRCRV